MFASQPFLRCILASVLALVSACALAADYADGVRAYHRGDVAAARIIWEELASGGDSRALYRIGLMIEDGEGIAPNWAVAATWYRKAADQGHADAQYRLGRIYRDALGVKRDVGEAARLLSAAAQQDHAGAQGQARYALRAARPTGIDVEAQIREWLARSAATDNPRAQFGYSESTSNVAERIRSMRRAAEFGYVRAQSALAELYLRGIAAADDPAAYLHWERMAAQAGHSAAQFRLARVLLKGWYPGEKKIKVPTNYAEALHWMELARTGHKDAAWFYSLLQVIGIAPVNPADGEPRLTEPIPDDAGVQYGYFIRGTLPEEWLTDEAAKKFEVANAKQCAETECNKGKKVVRQFGVVRRNADGLYLPDAPGHDISAFARAEAFWRRDERRGIPSDRVRSLHWYRVAAEHGDLKAHRQLADLLWMGDEVTQDSAEACRHFAALARNPAAGRAADYDLYGLGLCAEFGLAGIRDLQSAIAWYRQAASRASGEGAYRLAMLLDRVGRTPRNDKEVAQLYRFAATQGVADAAFRLGLKYRDGRGLPINPESARIWMARSAAWGFAPARELLELIPDWIGRK